MKLSEIQYISERYKYILEPVCKRIEIAGSIRRKKENPRDIELVMIRNPEKTEELESIVGEWKKVRGSILGRYTQVEVEDGLKIDIFIAVDDGSNWGNIYLIRTGNWKFSRFMMGIRAKQVGLVHREGYLWRWEASFTDKKLKSHVDLCKISCYEEEDVFRELEMNWIPPENRSWE